MTANARAELDALLRRLADLLRRGAHGEAEALAAHARSTFPLAAELVRLHGVALLRLDRRHEARAALHRAVELMPDSIEAHADLANLALEEGRPDAAIERLRLALARAPGHPVLLQTLGMAQMMKAQGEQARETFLQAVAGAPRQPGPRLNLAEAELALGRVDEASAQVREALQLAPGLHAAHAAHGHVLRAQGNTADAAAAWLEAERLAPGEPRYPFQAGRMLEEAGQLAQAAEAYARALQRAPQSGSALSRLVLTRRRLADWRELDALTGRLREAMETDQPGVLPPALLAGPFDLALQRRAATSFATRIEHYMGPLRTQVAFARHPPSPDAPIRIGLVSDGFGEHAVGRAVVALVEALAALGGLDLHLFATQADDGGPVRQRLAAAASMHAIDALPPAQAARRIHALGIEVLFDLTGYGANTNAELFALRPSPVQVNWLAYPGTSGAPWMDYLLADTVVLPASHRAGYSEKVLRLPRCFLPNDPERQHGPAPTRRDCGLPDAGRVFACFSPAGKLDPESFARFMLILREVPGSVLWLRSGPNGTDQRLRAAAAALDLDPARLVFLPPMPYADYLARYVLVDLRLDTLPCSAHTSAADALWAGCPVLTCAGDTFAGRVTASLLCHAHLPELVAEDADAFVAMAVQLGRDPDALATTRAHLARVRTHSPLFDMTGFASDFHRVAQTIGTRHRIGRPPIDLEF